MTVDRRGRRRGDLGLLWADGIGGALERGGKGDAVGIHRTPTVTGSHIHVVAAALVLALGIAAGCGPSEEDIRADVDKECVGLVARLSELEAEPAFRQLAAAAGEAGLRFGGAAYRIEDISSEGSAVDLAAALHAASDAYDEVERQLIRREYASLPQTAAAGKSALAQALAAAESLGATDCLGVDVRIGYFTIAADRAEAAAAKIGAYRRLPGRSVNAACARYAADTGIIFWKFGLRAYASELIESEPAARDYLKMVEDMVAIRTALDVTIARELGRRAAGTTSGGSMRS